MNILVHASLPRWGRPFGTALEIIQNHLDQGDQVTVLVCDAELPACIGNINNDPWACKECINIRKKGLSLLSQRVPVEQGVQYSPDVLAEIKALPKLFSSHEELSNLRIENCDIGFAVLSTLISKTRDPEVDLNKHSQLIQRFLSGSLAVYRTTQKRIRSEHVDRVYVFNGRHAPLRSVLRACQADGVECWVNEASPDPYHYLLFKDSLPQDLEQTKAEILKTWKEAASPQREEIGTTWFESRVGGKRDGANYFTKQQQQGLLPAGWNPNKRNIAIFSSSEDELAAVSDSWVNPLYRNQREGMRAIIESLKKDPGNLHLYLRMHPNTTDIHNSQTFEFFRLSAPFLTVIPPNDPVCTYTLMRKADTLLTFSSTAGIEAVYWGRPTILAGAAFYEDLKGVYRPSSHEKVIRLLKSDLDPQERTGALKYGHYMATRGVQFKNYEPIEGNRGRFKGRRVRPLWLLRIQFPFLRRIRKAFHWLQGKQRAA